MADALRNGKHGPADRRPGQRWCRRSDGEGNLGPRDREDPEVAVQCPYRADRAHLSSSRHSIAAKQERTGKQNNYISKPECGGDSRQCLPVLPFPKAAARLAQSRLRQDPMPRVSGPGLLANTGHPTQFKRIACAWPEARTYPVVPSSMPLPATTRRSSRPVRLQVPSVPACAGRLRIPGLRRASHTGRCRSETSTPFSRDQCLPLGRERSVLWDTASDTRSRPSPLNCSL